MPEWLSVALTRFGLLFGCYPGPSRVLAGARGLISLRSHKELPHGI